VILIDANLLIYAYDASSEFHGDARRWLEKRFSDPAPVRLSWSTIHAFLRLTTHPAVFTTTLTMSDASQIVDSWLALPSLGVLEPGNAYWAIFRRLLLEAQVRGALVMDAHLAALAIEHGATLYTTDRDFARFEGLRVVNPLRSRR
jgi:toxin-antitoxin system PIN domain toxin